jgi:hypothetical protein
MQLWEDIKATRMAEEKKRRAHAGTAPKGPEDVSRPREQNRRKRATRDARSRIASSAGNHGMAGIGVRGAKGRDGGDCGGSGGAGEGGSSCSAPRLRRRNSLDKQSVENKNDGWGLGADRDNGTARFLPELKRRVSGFGSSVSTGRDGSGLQTPAADPPLPLTPRKEGGKERRKSDAERTHGRLGEVAAAASANPAGQTCKEGTEEDGMPSPKPRRKPPLRRQGSNISAELNAPAHGEAPANESTDGRSASEQGDPILSNAAPDTPICAPANAEPEHAVRPSLPVGALPLTGGATSTLDPTPQLGAMGGLSRPSCWCPAQRYRSKPALATPPPIGGTPASAPRAQTPNINILELGAGMGPELTVCTGSGDRLVAQLAREAAAGGRATMHSSVSNSASMPVLRSAQVVEPTRMAASEALPDGHSPESVADTLRELAASGGTSKLEAVRRQTTAARSALQDPLAPTLLGARGAAAARLEVLPEDGAERRAQQLAQLHQAPPGRALSDMWGLAAHLAQDAGTNIAARSAAVKSGTMFAGSTPSYSESIGYARPMPDLFSLNGAECSTSGLAPGGATGLSLVRVGDVRGAQLASSMLRVARSRPRLTIDPSANRSPSRSHDGALARSPTGAGVLLPSYRLITRARESQASSSSKIAHRACAPAAAAAVVSRRTQGILDRTTPSFPNAEVTECNAFALIPMATTRQAAYREELDDLLVRRSLQSNDKHKVGQRRKASADAGTTAGIGQTRRFEQSPTAGRRTGGSASLVASSRPFL